MENAGSFGIERVGTERYLIPIGEAVSICVGVERIGAEAIVARDDLFPITNSVIVRVGVSGVCSYLDLVYVH